VPHFNIPWFYPGKIVVTIHDLLWHEQRGTTVTTLPAWQYWLKYLAYRWTTQLAVWRARRIFVPTKTVAKTLAGYYPGHQSKIVITPEGAGKTYAAQLKSTPPSKEKRKPQLIYTGSLYPHKNIKLIVQALPFLPEFTLLLAGSRTVFQEELRQYVAQQHLTNRVEFLGHLTDQALIKRYQQAYAFVFPSLSEGFGLPGLEAMAAGLPVIAADIPVFKEVYGEAAAYFDPNSVAELVETVRVIEPSWASLVKAGRKRVKQFSWDEMVTTTVEEYQAAL
jgi:glycosyltransferase involved in cell wall biosynthesis